MLPTLNLPEFRNGCEYSVVARPLHIQYASLSVSKPCPNKLLPPFFGFP